MKFRRRKSIILVALIFISVLAAFYFLGRRKETASTINISQDEINRQNEDHSSVVLEHFHRSETKNDKTLWEIQADRGEYLQSTTLAGINNVKLYNAIIDYYREDGTKVRMYSRNGNVFLEGTTLTKADVYNGVKVVYGNELVITTEKATYDQKEGKITTNTRSIIKGTTMVVSADNLALNVDTKFLRMTDNVETVIAKNDLTNDLNENFFTR